MDSTRISYWTKHIHGVCCAHLLCCIWMRPESRDNWIECDEVTSNCNEKSNQTSNSIVILIASEKKWWMYLTACVCVLCVICSLNSFIDKSTKAQPSQPASRYNNNFAFFPLLNSFKTHAHSSPSYVSLCKCIFFFFGSVAIDSAAATIPPAK